MINIGFLQFRRNMYPVSFYYLNKISDTNKEKIHLSVYTQGEEDKKNILSYLEKNIKNINYTIIDVGKGINYLKKIKGMIDSNYEYTIKHDEDCFINNYVWDYWINNIDILNNRELLFFAPALSNNIPSVEYFVNNYLTKEEQSELHSIYLKTTIDEDRWGADGIGLNNYTIKADKWEPDKWYNHISKMQHYYKGFHPIRFSFDAHSYLNNLILNKFKDFELNRDYKTEIITRPYYCNSFFAIKTDTYNSIYYNDSLHRDGFDEVPINLFMQKNNKKMAFITNSFGIHIAYQACKDVRITKMEHDFYNKFKGLVFNETL